MEWRQEKLASRLMEILRSPGICPKLSTIVLGSEAGAVRVGTVRAGHNIVPHRFFVPGEQKDVFGRTKMVAVEVSEYLLRDAEPLSDIIDFDSTGERISRGVGMY